MNKIEIDNDLPFTRSYWVLPKLLIAGEIPSAIDLAETTRKLTALVRINTRVVINLMEADDKNYQGQPFLDYSDRLKDLGKPSQIETYRFPIKDISIPSKKLMTEILDVMDEAIGLKKTVYVHCWGGIGRTGTTIGCYLLRHGLADKNNVFNMIDELKKNTPIRGRKSPETEEQRQFVLDWG